VLTTRPPSAIWTLTVRNPDDTSPRQVRTFRGPVYLVNGDSRVYNTDRPFAAGSKWLGFYGVSGTAGNLTRITDDADNYLKFAVQRRSAQVLAAGAVRLLTGCQSLAAKTAWCQATLELTPE